MNAFVQPGDLLLTQAKLKSQSDNELVLVFRSTVGNQKVCVLEAVFTQRD